MVTYADDIITANGKSALVWASDVQEVVNKTNEDAAEEDADAAKLKPVLEATNQIQLLAALQANFERVNADWIAEYGTGTANSDAGIKIDSDKTVDNEIFVDDSSIAVASPEAKDVQATIDFINNKQIDLANGTTAVGADTAAKQAKVTALIQDWVKADDPKTPAVTPKADAIKASKAKEAAFRVAEATTANSLYNALVAYANATPDAALKASEVKDNLKADYKDALDATGVKAALITQIKTDHAAASVGVKAVLVTAVNESLGGFVVADATVPAGATATPKFKVTALRKDGEAFDLNKAATSIKVTIGTQVDKAYKVSTGKDFTDVKNSELEIEVDSSNFNLPTIGAVVDPVITFTADSVVRTVKGKLTVTAGANNDAKTAATMTLDKTDGKYVSGEDVIISFTLKNADDITLVSENGTYAATITLDTEKIYKDITFVNGKATVTVPARTATATAADVKVELTTKDNGAVSITKAASIEIKAAAFSELEIKADTSKKVELTATDGVNPITDFGTKLVNIKVVQVTGTGENTVETPVEMTGTDYAGNISATFASGVYTNAKVLAAGTYKVTVTVAGVTTTKTIVVSA